MNGLNGNRGNGLNGNNAHNNGIDAANASPTAPAAGAAAASEAASWDDAEERRGEKEEKEKVCGGAAVVGLVASAPLEAGAAAVADYLEQLKAAAPSVVGIRQGLWTDDETALFDNP